MHLLGCLGSPAICAMIVAASLEIWGGISWVWSPAWSSADWIVRSVVIIRFKLSQVSSCMNRAMASAVNTMVRWASPKSRWRWNVGLA